MAYSRIEDVPAELRARASGIRLVGFDVDGTLSDGKLYYGADGEAIKAFNVHDGQGLKLLREHGIEVALITARDSAVVTARARDLGLSHVFQGVRDKRDCLLRLMQSLGLDAPQIAFMGDDLPDLPALTLAGLSVAPANAHPWVRARVHWCTQARGGEGAVRELCDLILVAQGHAEGILARYLGAARPSTGSPA